MSDENVYGEAFDAGMKEGTQLSTEEANYVAWWDDMRSHVIPNEVRAFTDEISHRPGGYKATFDNHEPTVCSLIVTSEKQDQDRNEPVASLTFTADLNCKLVEARAKGFDLESTHGKDDPLTQKTVQNYLKALAMSLGKRATAPAHEPCVEKPPAGEKPAIEESARDKPSERETTQEAAVREPVGR
jgi:hypothetical protein